MPRKYLTFPLSAALLLSHGCFLFAQGEGLDLFGDSLVAAAASAPKAPFEQNKTMPQPFRYDLVLHKRIVCRDGVHWVKEFDASALPLTNLEIQGLYQAFKATKAKEQEVAPPPDQLDARLKLGEYSNRIQSIQSIDADTLFDGSNGMALEDKAVISLSPTPQDSQERKRKIRGPRLRGLWFLGGQDKEGQVGEVDDDVARDAEGHSGLSHLADVDFSLRLSETSMGVKAKWRDPVGVDSFNLGAKIFTDVPDLVGAGHVRDGIYDLVGRHPRHDIAGYQLSLGTDLNPNWSLNAVWTDREQTKGDQFSHDIERSLSATFRPLGWNVGHDWNYDVFFGVNRKTITRDGNINDGLPGFSGDGYGYVVGAAWQQSLRDVPVPFLKGWGPKSDSGVWLDNYRLKATLSDGQVEAMTTRLAVELTAYITEHIKFRFEPFAQYRLSDSPGIQNFGSQEPLQFGISTGLSFQF